MEGIEDSMIRGVEAGVGVGKEGDTRVQIEIIIIIKRRGIRQEIEIESVQLEVEAVVMAEIGIEIKDETKKVQVVTKKIVVVVNDVAIIISANMMTMTSMIVIARGLIIMEAMRGELLRLHSHHRLRY